MQLFDLNPVILPAISWRKGSGQHTKIPAVELYCVVHFQLCGKMLNMMLHLVITFLCAHQSYMCIMH